MSTTHTNEKPLIRTFPDAVLYYLEPNTLPVPIEETRRRLFSEEERFQQASQATARLKQLIDTVRKPTVQLIDDSWVSWGAHNTLKQKINLDPVIALKAYLLFDTGWTMEEIVALVEKDPETAYWLARKDADAPITRLQQAANHDPQYAYNFGLNVNHANKGMALEATTSSPYYHFLALSKIRGDNTLAEDYLKHLAAYDPEAAYTWFRTRPIPAAEPTYPAVFETLLESPKWCYLLAAHKCVTASEDPHSAWQRLRTSALQTPQWAYHWLLLIEPTLTPATLALVARHPGWACQLLADLPDTTSDAIEQQRKHIAQVYNLVRNNITQLGLPPYTDPFEQALNGWMSTKYEEWNKDKPDTNDSA